MSAKKLYQQISVEVTNNIIHAKLISKIAKVNGPARNGISAANDELKQAKDFNSDGRVT